MKTYTADEVIAIFDKGCAGLGELRHDEHGQLVVYTGIFEWNDSTFHDRPDPNYNNE